MTRRFRTVLLLSFLAAAIASAESAGASASTHEATASDAKGDLTTGDPSRDIVSNGFKYDSSGRAEFSVTMAAPIDPSGAPLQVRFMLMVRDSDGYCVSGLDRRIDVTVNASGQNNQPATFTHADYSEDTLAPATTTVDGTHLTAVLTSDKIANLDYVCEGVFSEVPRADNHPTQVDASSATESGVFWKPPPTKFTAQVIAGSLAVRGAAAKIGSILKAGGYRAYLSATGYGHDKIVWTHKGTVVAKGATYVNAPGPYYFQVKLTPAGRALLKRARRSISLTATGSFTPDGSTAVKKSTTITLKR